MSRWNFSVLVMVLALLVGSVSAHAATFTVTTNADAVDVNPGDGLCADGAGRCTLRAAVMEANALAGPDTIVIPAGTYTLAIPGAGEDAAATGDLDLLEDVTINGAGTASTILDGGGLDRVLHVGPGATVQINALTVRHGDPGPAANAGGILNFAGTVVLNAVTVSGNTAAQGGGIVNETGTMVINASTISGNTAAVGGGLYNHGAMTVTRSTLSGNRALVGSGGGVWHNGGPLSLTNSTVSGNSAAEVGGGIFNTGTVVSLVNSTVADNTATEGGGIANTVNASLRNTIVAGSGGGNCSGTIGSLGYNLSSDATCAFAGPGDLNGTNPQLAPLAASGGPTETRALLPGSPAIDAVPPAACVVTSDQRGVLRPQGAACDAGAFETVPAACVAPPSGLVAWWPMDEPEGAASVQDIVGGNNLNTVTSPLGASQAPQPAAGVVGGAIEFPKFGNALSGARVSPTGALATIGAADFSIDAWVLVPPAAGNRRHYVVNRFDFEHGKGYALSVVSAATPGTERLEFTWGDGATVSTVSSTSFFATDVWHHVAVTFKRGAGAADLEVRLYVDGVPGGQQLGAPASVGSLVSPGFVEVGWEPNPLDAPITLDELEIFAVALPPSSVAAIFNAGSAGKCRCTTGGQFVDLSVIAGGITRGLGIGVGATVSGRLIVNYSLQACSGHEMFLLLRAPALGLPSYEYYDGTLGTFAPLPDPLSQVRPFMRGGPATETGSHTLFTGTLPPGNYDLYLICDQVQDNRLDVVAGPPVCLNGAFDNLPLTVQ